MPEYVVSTGERVRMGCFYGAIGSGIALVVGYAVGHLFGGLGEGAVFRVDIGCIVGPIFALFVGALAFVQGYRQA